MPLLIFSKIFKKFTKSTLFDFKNVLYYNKSMFRGICMKEKVSVLIGDDSKNFGEKCSIVLRNSGYSCTACTADHGDILSLVNSLKPNVIIISTFINGSDPAELINCVRAISDYDPIIIVVFDYENPFIKGCLRCELVDYYMRKPYNFELLCKRLSQLVVTNTEGGFIGVNHPIDTDYEITIRVTDVLSEIGIPTSFNGYRYIRSAIIYAIKCNLKGVHSVKIYEYVSQKYGEPCSRIEKAMRSAIEVAFTSGCLKTISKYFNINSLTRTGRPSNIEFIARIADIVSIEIEKVI